MTLNHLHIGTRDLGKSKEFYETFFGFKKQFDHGDGVFLENEAGFLLAIDPVVEIQKFPECFHIGFCLQTKNQVQSIYEKMMSLGIIMTKEYQEYGSDAAAFYTLDPDGYKIEVSWHND